MISSQREKTVTVASQPARCFITDTVDVNTLLFLLNITSMFLFLLMHEAENKIMIHCRPLQFLVCACNILFTKTESSVYPSIINKLMKSRIEKKLQLSNGHEINAVK